MRTVREAILLAADHIERNPKEFYFKTIHVPAAPACGTPGCAIGWIGCFYGARESEHFSAFRESCHALGLADGSGFYARMDKIDSARDWMSNPASCAGALRKYADVYHPAPKEEKPKILHTKRTGIPEDIRAIFNPSFHRDRTEVVRGLVRS